MPLGEVERTAQRAQRGQRAAFAELVERFQAPLLHFMGLRCGSREDAEELVQETFLRAWRYLDRYDPKRPFATWLYTMARRLTISEMRRQRPVTAEQDALEEIRDASEHKGPSAIASAREERENLWHAARRWLNDDQYAALWLRYGEQLDSHGIARVLDKREPTVRVLLFRARERLARNLEGQEIPATTVTPAIPVAAASRYTERRSEPVPLEVHLSPRPIR